MLPPWIQALWDGVRLRCPACRRGGIFRSWFETWPRCRGCGVAFQPHEGDFLGTMAVTYGITVGLALALLAWTWARTDWTLGQHLGAYSAFCVVWYLGFYRNMKGLWIGLLYLMTGPRPRT